MLWDECLKKLFIYSIFQVLCQFISPKTSYSNTFKLWSLFYVALYVVHICTMHSVYVHVICNVPLIQYLATHVGDICGIHMKSYHPKAPYQEKHLAAKRKYAENKTCNSNWKRKSFFYNFPQWNSVRTMIFRCAHHTPSQWI